MAKATVTVPLPKVVFEEPRVVWQKVTLKVPKVVMNATANGRIVGTWGSMHKVPSQDELQREADEMLKAAKVVLDAMKQDPSAREALIRELPEEDRIIVRKALS